MSQVDKQQIKQDKAEKQTQAAVEALTREALLDLAVTDVRKISRSDALEIARSYGKDWQYEKSFHQTNQNGQRVGYKGVQNSGAVDLIEVLYTSLDGRYTGSLFVGHSYNRDVAGFQDFIPGDVISIFGQQGRMISVFNHATNLLTSCFDTNHITLHPNTGVEVQDRAQSVMELVQKTVTSLKSQGQLTDLGNTPRFYSDQVSYRYKPEHKNNNWIIWVIVLALGGYQFYYLVTNYNAFLVTFGTILFLVLGYFIYSNRTKEY